MARGTIDKIEEKSNLSEITIKENTIIKGTIVPSDKFILIRLSNEDKYGSKDSAKSILQIGNIIKISVRHLPLMRQEIQVSLMPIGIISERDMHTV